MRAPISITVPKEFKQAVEGRISAADFSRWGLEALVVEAVREGLITRGYAGELLGLGFHEREEFFASRCVTYDLCHEDIAQERSDLNHFFSA